MDGEHAFLPPLKTNVQRIITSVERLALEFGHYLSELNRVRVCCAVDRNHYYIFGIFRGIGICLSVNKTR